MAVPPPSTKAALRRELRALRRLHVAALRASAEWSSMLGQAAALALPPLRSLQMIALYRATVDELSADILAEMLADQGCSLALPRLRPHSPEMEFAGWCPSDALVEGPYGIHQPTADQPCVVPDVIITPLVGFDREGRRLGQGGGYYDRAFRRYPDVWRIGYAWSMQEVDAVPTDPWDQPLHAVVTEREWIDCRPA